MQRGCGVCEKICPSGTITMNMKRPEWTEERCIHCLACLHRCPQNAIQYGRKTDGRGRYINPNNKLDI
ncbi:EFR1 family ferrodoxin [Gudongella oleilytica]|uniref:EFR1 family ferrodoxin n=1 Tax=Gudongella oleilytica TaxID=1582259 RepID=UPI00387E1F87